MHHHRLLSKSLNDGMDWEIVRRNVAKKAKPPKPDRPEMKVLDEHQLILLLEVAEKTSPFYYPAISTAAQTGMRMSEVLGLRWEDVDLINKRLYIRQTITSAGSKNYINTTTKNKSNRSISMTKNHVSLLLRPKEQHINLKKSLGESYNPLNLVHCNSVGNIMSSSEVTRGLKRALRAANLPDIRFHDLRHSHATILLLKNVHPKVVSARLGHKKIAITMDLYSHVTRNIEERAVSELDDIFDQQNNHFGE